MLRRLQRQGGDVDAFLERLGLFDAEPSPMAKYVIASETTLEVIEVLLARLWGEEEAAPKDIRADLTSRLEGVGLSGAEAASLSSCESFTGRDAVVEDLKRQVSALQRQLQMQGDVVKVAASLERRLDEVSAALERRVGACEESQRGAVARVDDAVARMSEGLAGAASAESVTGLLAEVSRLKESEARLEELERASRDGIVARLRQEVNDEGRAGDIEEVVANAASLMARGGSLPKLLQRLNRIEEDSERKEERKRKEEEERKRKEEEERKKIGVFDCGGGGQLNGIIAHLTGECGGNVADKGEVAVTASSVCNPSNPLKNVVDLESNSEFFTHNKPDSWICYDFKGRRVTPTSYSIKSEPWGPGFQHPKSWVLEVSDDGSEGSWRVVDRRDDNNDLNDRSVTRNFVIAAVAGRRFRFVRLRQTGKNHQGNDYLWISALEIFGTLSHE